MKKARNRQQPISSAGRGRRGAVLHDTEVPSTPCELQAHANPHSGSQPVQAIKLGVAPGTYDTLYPGDAKFTAGSACSGLYRGLKLWEAAVREAGSLGQDDVIKALNHAKIAEGPGGAAEMVPGEHHVRMNMYIAQASNGHFEIVKNLGVIDPKERNVHLAEVSPMRAAG
jgi:Periplasmic binding protein